jgi:MoxR-like ATPase
LINLYPADASVYKPTSPKSLPAFKPSSLREPNRYIRDSALADAVNVALLLRQPLLLTGEPGTGKSELASSVAWELGLEPPLVFETKSTTVAKDLFYVYDTLGRFTAHQLEGRVMSARDYLYFSALGEAIVRTRAPEHVASVLPTDYTHPGPRRSVVLIDEVEKAPRDFPNDILNEIERMYFRIPELQNVRIDADESLFPVVVLTSNSEK